MSITEATGQVVQVVSQAAAMSKRLQMAIQDNCVSKADRSPVTIADLAVQALISHSLILQSPDTKLVGEEGSQVLRDPANAHLLRGVLSALDDAGLPLDAHSLMGILDRGNLSPSADEGYWVLDPIDGTKGVLRGQQYAIALAYVEDGVVTRGILACPALSFRGPMGVLAVAERGRGAWVYDHGSGAGPKTRLHVSSVSDITQARFCESVESGHSAHGWSAKIADRLGIVAEPVRMDSQCKYFALAAGLAEIYLRLPVSDTYVEKVWDHAAGMIIVEEAGGVVTDVSGQQLDFRHGRLLAQNSGVIVATPSLHESVLEAVASTR